MCDNMYTKSFLISWVFLLLPTTGIARQCSNCLNETCNSDGECLKGCVRGYVDIRCDEKCPPTCLNNLCHIDRKKGTYACSEGCQDGFCGVGCKTRCPEGCTRCDRASCSKCNVTICSGNRYGSTCSETCHPNYELCDKETGECIKCKSHYYGRECEKPCPKCLTREEEAQQMCQSGCTLCSSEDCPRGFYGDVCDKRCPINCAPRTDIPECGGTGQCLFGCKPGFYGIRCDHACSELCASKKCLLDSGICSDGCIEGYTLFDNVCTGIVNQRRVRAVSVAVASVIFVCLVVSLLCFIYLRCSSRTNSTRAKRPREDELPLLNLNLDLVVEEKTKSEISLFTRDMVEVSAVAEVVQRFERGINWITVTGNPGDGKTTVGYLVLKHFQTKMEVYKLDTPDEYRHISQKGKDRIILLDDIFGVFISNESSIRKWIPVLREILEEHEHNTERKVYNRIILTSRRNVLQGAKSHLERYGDKLLEGKCVIDLTQIPQREERLRILECHLLKNNISVDPDVMQTVTDLDSSHGFPLCCKMYSHMRKNDRCIDIIKFFKYPLILNDTTKVLVEIHGCRSLFKNMIMNGGKFDINSVVDDKERQDMLDAAASLDGSYILKDHDSVCHFTSGSIYQSVLRTVAIVDPMFVAKYAALNDILKYVNIDTSSEEFPQYVNITPNPLILETLVKRFQPQLQDKNYSIFKERLCFNQGFCAALVSNCVFMGSKQKASKQHIEERDRAGRTMLVTAAMYGNTTAVAVLVNSGANVNIFDEKKTTTLHFLCGAPVPVDHGSNVQVSEEEGTTTLHPPSHAPVPASENSGRQSHPLRKIDIESIKLVLSKGALLTKDKDGYTPLDYMRTHHPEEREAIQLLEKASKK